MRDWELRMKVAKLLIAWGVASSDDDTIGFGDETDPVYKHLAWLLYYQDSMDLMHRFRIADRQKLEWLLGPHGHIIYKIMLLRRNSDADP